MRQQVTGEAAIQGSEAWHELRRTHIGASMSAALLGKNPYMTAADVYDQMVLGKVQYVNDAMKRGTEQEPVARAFYNKLEQITYSPKVFTNDSYPYLMASLDGWHEESKTILEIKTPGEKMYAECFSKIPSYWHCQLQHQLLVTEAEIAVLMIWKNENEYQILTYDRDERMINEIEVGCQKFFNEHLLEFNRPKSKEKNYEFKENSHLEQLLREYREAKSARIAFQKSEDTYKELIVEYCQDKSIRTPSSVIEKTEVKGRIDYDLIEELKEINIEQYRKPSTFRWTINESDVK